MSIPRPDTTEVLEIIEKETHLDWTVLLDEPDKMRFTAVSFQFDIVWDGDYWTFKLYDLASASGESEPRWAEGPMHNATEIKNSLPGFIPHEVRTPTR